MRKTLATIRQHLFFDWQEKRGVISVHNGYSLLFAFNLILLFSALIFIQPQLFF
jgi:hypothetical protein